MLTATVELIADPEEEAVATTGAVSSAQEAELRVPAPVLERLWRPPTLEHLARAYWRYLRRASLGAVRVVYAESSRTVVLLAPSLALLRFRAPEYEIAPDAASVTWRIDRGLLVAAEGRGSGWLRIEVRRPDDDRPGVVRARVEVRNFYPWLRGSGRFARLGAWLYSRTQLRIHRRITIGFLRSLGRVELE